MPRRLVAGSLALALALLTAPPRARAATPGTTTEPYPGVRYTVWTTDGPAKSRIHVVELDLSSAELTLVATGSEERGQTVSAFAAARGAQVAINGDFFSPQGFVPAGLARGGGVTWDDTADDERSGFIQLSKQLGGTEAIISAPDETVPALDDEVAAAVGGRPMLVEAGAARSPDCADTETLACVAAPRTAVALSEDGRRMFLIVVDGWQADSAGVTAAELGSFIAADLGGHRALMLDAGSASSLFIDAAGGLVSSPSDGAERRVANHLAVIHGALPPGVIQGHVFDTVVGGDRLPGATVTLDTGDSITYDGSQLWSFVVAPRWACVTGSADGYLDQTQCRQIDSGAAVFASLALIPENAATGDAGVGGGDAGVDPEPEDGGCGCRTGGQGAGNGLVLALLLLAAGRRRKRPNRGAAR